MSTSRAITVSGLDQVTRKLNNASKLHTVLNRAAKRTSEQVKTMVSSEIRKELALKKSYVDQKINTRFTIATEQDQTVKITVSTASRNILFKEFKFSFQPYNKWIPEKRAPRPRVIQNPPPPKRAPAKTKMGRLRITITPGEPRVIKRAFMLTLKGGNGKTPVWRKSPAEKAKDPGSGKFHFLAMHAPSPSQVFDTKMPIVEEQGTELFKKNLEHEIQYMVSKL